ncbi:hypothetical protein H1R20_g15782, partial [Candolleomyces eurysporus]
MAPTTPRTRARKQTSQTPVTPSRKRNPQRCRRCPDQPLRSECVHGYRRNGAKAAAPGASGGDGLGTEAAADTQAATVASPAPVPFPLTYANLAQLHALAVSQGILPGGSDAGTGVLVGGNPFQRAEADHMAPPSTAFPLDPALADLQPQAGQAAVLPPEPSVEDSDNESNTAPLSVPSSPQSMPSPRKARVFASNCNPTHGFIEGVGRGNTLLEMARVRQLKTVAVSRKSATRRFNRLARDLFTRAEDLSNQTACWMYVAMHHPGSGHSFLHFASRRLRNEASDELRKIHQEVGSMMTMLKRADRAQHLDHERERLEAERKVSEADARAAKAESELVRLREELAARNEILTSLAPPSGSVSHGHTE